MGKLLLVLQKYEYIDVIANYVIYITYEGSSLNKFSNGSLSAMETSSVCI